MHVYKKYSDILFFQRLLISFFNRMLQSITDKIAANTHKEADLENNIEKRSIS